MRRLLGAAALLIALCGPALAASYTCGRYMRTQFPHLPAGINFDLALKWAEALPHTLARPGAVVVQTRAGRAKGGGPGGHVSKILELRGHCRALVRDNRGAYERDICRRLVAYVQP